MSELATVPDALVEMLCNPWWVTGASVRAAIARQLPRRAVAITLQEYIALLTRLARLEDGAVWATLDSFLQSSRVSGNTDTVSQPWPHFGKTFSLCRRTIDTVLGLTSDRACWLRLVAALASGCAVVPTAAAAAPAGLLETLLSTDDRLWVFNVAAPAYACASEHALCVGLFL